MIITTRNFILVLGLHWLIGIGLIVLDFVVRADRQCYWLVYLSLGFTFGTAIITPWYFAHFCANTRWMEQLRAAPRYGTLWEQKNPNL
jgi:hypothetical protein